MINLSPQIRKSRNVLETSAAAWYSVVLLGQWIFVAYIFYAYGWPMIAGQLSEWNAHLSEAYIPGRHMGNGFVAAHLALAVIIHFFGPLQLVPAVRKRFPTFHRWVGRSFVFGVIVAIASGTYMLIARDIGEWPLFVGFGLQIVLVTWFAWLTVKYARAKKFSIHMRWATRLFLAASAVWFLRVIIMAWFVFTGGIGIDTSDGTGWFLNIMAIAQFTPVLIYEIYIRIKEGTNAKAHYAMTAFMGFATIFTVIGVTFAALGMWFSVLG